jgi:polysaccharide chain length determinant protein (PEP-CTERM system associated)
MAEELEPQAEKIDLEHYWSLARRRQWYFLLPFFGVWLLVWCASWLLPSTYRSSTLILVEQPAVPQQYVTPNVSASDLQNRLDSMTEQILSRTRLQRIIDTRNLYLNERDHRTSEELVERMRKDITVELVRAPDRQVTAFNVFYSSKDPLVAQTVTSDLTNLFINENLEFRQQRSENTTEFLTSQLEEARQGLAAQEQKLREYKDKHIGELPTQLQGNIQILSGLQNQLQGEQDALGRAKQQNVYLESLVNQYRSAQGTVSGGDAPQGLPAIEQELARLRAQLADLSSHYTDKHPDVRKLKDQIAKTERMKLQLEAGLASSASTEHADSDAALSSSPPVMELQSQLKANQIEIANRQESIRGLKAKIAEYQGRLNQTPVREQQLADLSRDYEQSRTNYESLLAKKNQSALATNLERQQQGENFRILDPPSLPSKPFSPDRLKLSVIGLFAGIVVGGGVAAAAEYTDDHLYSEKELKILVPVPVLAELPAIPTVAEEQQRRRKLHLGFAYTGFMLAVMVVGILIVYRHG